MKPIGQVPSSINSLIKEFRTIANNMANASTTGFKRTVNSFSKELQNKQEAAGSMGNALESRGLISSKSRLDLTQGILTRSERPLDLAINGNGWFVIETEEGVRYTRNGKFFSNSNGQLTDPEGNLIAGVDGPIIIPPETAGGDLVIAADGTVSAGQSQIGKLKIIDFKENESLLRPVGKGKFIAPADIRPKQAENVHVEQGYLETSNVNITEEMVDLIKVMRMYEANMKLMSKKSESSKAILEVAAG